MYTMLLNEDFIMARIKKLKSNAKDIVVQSNSIIETPKDLNLLEYKLFMLVVSKIDPHSDVLPVFKISAEEFANVIGAKDSSTIYRDLRKAADRLITRSAQIYFPERNLTVKTNITKQVHYWHGEGYIEIALSEAIKPYLLNLHREFTQYKLSSISRLSSIYAVRLYEMLKKQEMLGKRIFSITELRVKLGITEKQYSRFGDFKRYVLDIAQREINDKTDLVVDYELKKERQKFVAIKFDISSKSTGSYYLPIEQQSPIASVNKIMNLGYPFPKALGIYHEAETTVVENAVDAVDEQIEKGKARNPKAMLQTAIKEKWEPKKKKMKLQSVENSSKKKSSEVKRKNMSYISKVLDLFR